MKSLLFFLCLLAGIESYSQIKLPRLISDEMVLQRGVKIKLWGWAAPHEKITQRQKNIVSGPLYKSIKKIGNKLVVFLDDDEGLASNGNQKLNYFSIAGRDKKFVWAHAKIENNKVVVWSDEVADPFIVRYAWADNPKGANLCNKKLPASPFEAIVDNSKK